MSKVNKVVLAYSGGLDTSIILKWLEDTYGCEVVTFTADIGQGEELEPARRKAEKMGVKEIYIEDLKEEFARDFVFPMFRANTIYEGEYLLGTASQLFGGHAQFAGAVVLAQACHTLTSSSYGSLVSISWGRIARIETSSDASAIRSSDS